ncbi:hypothetical protein [Desulfosporosinus youngiae]|uniref:Cell shape-determining protein n=1 Tax=Desulfosporosinus youngiae DSM 17734 TaxID=768710 RepID=H5Y5W9_9FIRM|nr:hypothetical protein [Desulfosporosinus youngiae]EHQ90908.1 hypothetical protein DesyoDRAFT_3935 [Desulfosporosinus youngiae DSM 17734]
MKNTTGRVITVIIWLALILISYYFLLIPMNIQSLGFWIYLSFVLLLGAGLFFLQQLAVEKKMTMKKQVWSSLLILSMLVAAAGGIMAVYSMPIFHAQQYAGLIEKQEGNFSQDVAEITFDQVPAVDRDTAQRLGDRKMGEIVELVSQFSVASDYTQINYQGKPVRVSPLEYAGFFKWLNNRQAGIPNYIVVDMINGEVTLEKPKQTIMYSESERFGSYVKRYLRFKYLTDIFGDFSFEIDEEGTPYWIVSVHKNSIGPFGGTDVKEVIMLNASTGEHQKISIEDVPTWVDRVFESELVLDQVNYNGKYQGGFWNSLFGQQGVLATTDGYNYLAVNDDVYLYTGITSVVRDESNIGFILVNLRTKETSFYSIPSAEEYSAMDSAQGAVQEKGYVSTFPILLNISGEPVYFMSLKDNAGLIKMYALVDAADYQKVVIGVTVEETLGKFTNKGIGTTEKDPQEPKEQFELAAKITDIKNLVIEGNTYYYILLEGQADIYTANISLSERLPFLKIGDEISINYVEVKETVNSIVKLN